MERDLAQEVLHWAPFGYAYHALICDSDGNPEDYVFLEVNPSFEQMTGLKGSEIVGKRVTEVLPTIRESGFDWIEHYGQIAQKGGTEEFIQYAEPLGRWYKVTVISRETGYFVTLFQEITNEMMRICDLEQTERRITDLVNDVEMVFNSTQDAMFLVGLEDGSFRYISSNATHQKLTGLDSSLIKGRTPVQLVGEEMGRKIESNYRKCFDSREAIIYEERLDLPGGSRVWLTSLTPVIKNGKVEYLVGSSKDITLQKQAEEKLEELLKNETILGRLSRLALREKRTDDFVTGCLQIIGRGMGVSGACVYLSEPIDEDTRVSWRWVSGAPSHTSGTIRESEDPGFSDWMKRLETGEILRVVRLEEESRPDIRGILEARGAKSFLALPMHIYEEYYGFLGLEECETEKAWTDSDENLVSVAAEVIAQYLNLQKKERQLWAENARFQAMVNSTDDIIYQLDREQRHVAVYGRWLNEHELSPDALLGKTANDWFGVENARVHQRANERALAGEHVVYQWSMELGGQVKHYQTSLAPIRDRRGQVSGLVGVGRDITLLVNAQREIEREKELLRITLQSIGDAVVTTDPAGRVTSVNRVAQELTGWSQEDALGLPFADVLALVNEETGELAQNPVARTLSTGTITGLANHTALIARDGTQISIADSAAPIIGERGQIHGVVMVFRDVSKEKDWQRKILYLSYHDSLTGLSNRRYMEEAVRKIEASGRLPLSVIMADVNGLKLVNDVFGHEEGDRLLIMAAQIIRRHCRKNDVIARWGGDEFLILMPDTPMRAAEQIAEEIKSCCGEPDKEGVALSIALGCAAKTSPHETMAQTIKEAEERMYRQKLNEGKSYRNHIIGTLLATLFAKSAETEEHAERLRNYCLRIGLEMGLSVRELDELALLAVLHDVGKVGIKEEVLKKPGPFTEEDWEEMRRHPEIGCRIAQNTPELVSVAEHILCHHERWDGKGYPRGIQGQEIPLLCRILAVVDAYDAMTSDRPYHFAVTRDEAIEEIKRHAGSQFDPEVVGVFLQILSSNEALDAGQRGTSKM